MGIMVRILILFLFSIVLMIAGFVKKSKLLKGISITAFAISLGMFLLVWYALAYM